ncbi:alpha/beta hydrolase [Bellilinea sp.]|uniref:alpha/beta hydrolase n=1 Tax=Bellilinea sp. TaxID=2838785 RepID=UPI002ADD6A00|nr:alpha/beta hydrolase [Bellilinea sp.]
MTVIEFNWNSDHQISYYGIEWKPDQSPRGVIILVHGLGEHSGRYQHLAQLLNQHGYAVIASDHAGHGQTGGKRGHVDSYECFFEELDTLLSRSRQNYPDLPIFLYGHSLGGSIILAYLLKRAPNVAGAIVTSPGIKLVSDPGVMLVFGKILNRLVPSTALNNGLKLEGLSKDPKVIQAYKSDPLVHPWISARLAIQLIETGEWIRENGEQIQVPVLLLHGNADQLTAVEGSRELAEKNRKYVTYIEWEGGYHELHNEPDKEQVFQVILKWLEEQVPVHSQ